MVVSHPVKRAILGAVFYLTVPDPALGNGRPQVADELLAVMPGIDETVILPQQFFA
jgi:hypothetical protein